MIGLKQLVLLKHGAPPRNVLEAALRAKWGGGGAGYEKTVGPLPIISISDAKAKPAKSLIVGMEPIQAGSGDPSPDNIRPITGRTGVTVDHSGATYPVTWQSEAGTVYGGTVDLVSGVLTVDRAIDIITKDSAWYGFSTGTGNSSAVFQLSNYLNVKYVDGASSFNGAISSTGRESPNYWTGGRQNETPNEGDMCFAYSQTGQLRFHRTDVANITDLASFKANFPDTSICYYLATPQTYQLTPTQIQLLKGSNVLWSDADDLTLTYIGTEPEEE